MTCHNWCNHEFCTLSEILKENVWPSVCDLKLKRTWFMQQDNDPKHTMKSTSEWLKKNKIKVLEWPNQSTDLNPIKMLWHDLKQSIHARKPSNVAELKKNLQRRVVQNSSTAMWKTHCQLLQTLDCSCCCQGWHNQLLDFSRAITFSHSARQVWIYSGYLCVILKFVWWYESFKCDKYAKNEKKKKKQDGGKNFFTPLYLSVCLSVRPFVFYY